MLRAFTYGFNPDLTVREYRNLREDQVELEQLYGEEEDTDITTLAYEFLTKLLGRTLLVFAFFVGALLLRKYSLLS